MYSCLPRAGKVEYARIITRKTDNIIYYLEVYPAEPTPSPLDLLEPLSSALSYKLQEVFTGQIRSSC